MAVCSVKSFVRIVTPGGKFVNQSNILFLLPIDHFKQNEDLFKEFEQDCVKFSKAAEEFGKFLGKEFVKPEIWKKRHQNYKKYLLEEMFKTDVNKE